jgi:hypothetical protein
LVKSSLISERRSEQLHAVVGKLKLAIASGMVPNVLFKAAKEVINRVVEESAESFLKTGPHSQGHHQSDWWLGAYHSDAFVRGATGIPTALKRAQKAGLTEYAAFLTELLPLQEMMQAAKPLIKKKGELPPARSAKQIAEDGERMTCQCCGRRILANMGSIAHHGYERQYYQTASCMGAKRLPFEADRKALGEMIEYMRGRLARAEKHRAAIKSEKLPIVFDYERQLIGPSRFQQFGRWVKWLVVKHSFNVSRESFKAFKAGPGSDSTYSIHDFDEYKARHVEYLSNAIKSLRGHINEEQARYDGWKQSHEWKGGQWVAM